MTRRGVVEVEMDLIPTQMQVGDRIAIGGQFRTIATMVGTRHGKRLVLVGGDELALHSLLRYTVYRPRPQHRPVRQPQGAMW